MILQNKMYLIEKYISDELTDHIKSIIDELIRLAKNLRGIKVLSMVKTMP